MILFSFGYSTIESALQLEKDVNKSLLRIESLAEEQNDAEFVMHLRTKFLKEQVSSIEDISKLITQLNRVGGDTLGLYLFDQVKEKVLKRNMGLMNETLEQRKHNLWIKTEHTHTLWFLLFMRRPCWRRASTPLLDRCVLPSNVFKVDSQVVSALRSKRKFPVDNYREVSPPFSFCSCVDSSLCLLFCFFAFLLLLFAFCLLFMWMKAWLNHVPIGTFLPCSGCYIKHKAAGNRHQATTDSKITQCTSTLEVGHIYLIRNQEVLSEAEEGVSRQRGMAWAMYLHAQYSHSPQLHLRAHRAGRKKDAAIFIGCTVVRSVRSVPNRVLVR